MTAKVVAFVGDLMDRSRIAAALPEAAFVATTDEAAGAAVVLVDLVRHGAAIRAIRAAAPAARIVAFGPHVDDTAFAAALADGATEAIARSRFFRDVRSAGLGAITDR